MPVLASNLRLCFPLLIPTKGKAALIEFTYDLSDLTREEILIGTLNKLLPTDII